MRLLEDRERLVTALAGTNQAAVATIKHNWGAAIAGELGIAWTKANRTAGFRFRPGVNPEEAAERELLDENAASRRRFYEALAGSDQEDAREHVERILTLEATGLGMVRRSRAVRDSMTIRELDDPR